MFRLLLKSSALGLLVLVLVIGLWSTDEPGFPVNPTAQDPTSQWRIALSGVKDLFTGRGIASQMSPVVQPLQNYLAKPRLLFTEKTNPITRKSCRCGPWGDCPKSVCSCEELCPPHYQVLDFTPDSKSGFFRSAAQSVSFENTDSDFLKQGYSREFGYCWGHVSLTRNFNALARFRPIEPSDAVPSSDLEKKKYYEIKIENVARGYFTEFPGFRDLDELSKAYPNYFSKTMARIWKSLAIHPKSLPSLLSTHIPMTPEKNETLIEDVRLRLKHGMQPKLFLGAWGVFGHVHIVRALSIEVASGLPYRTRICVEDPNVNFEQNKDCKNYLKFFNSGEVVYSRYEAESRGYREAQTKSDKQDEDLKGLTSGKIGSVGVTYEDDDEQVRLIEGARNFCMKVKECQ